MISITTAELLNAWERGSSQSSAQRVLTLLSAVHPDMPEVQLLKLPVGQRDGLVLQLREALFGPQLSILAVCPFCAERLELAMNVADIQIVADDPAPESFMLKCEDFELAFRLPDSQDLLRIETACSIEDARRLLFESCLLSASYKGQDCTVDQVPQEILDKVEAAMSDADPQADVQLDLFCPACQRGWTAAFEIASFLWNEINAWAQRVLNEVHLLAKAYAWCEVDILAMSPTRRRLYLERVMQ